MHALVIDDEAQLRKFVGDVLHEEGRDVNKTESAEQAFEMLRDREWAVVFCDVMLGDVNGFNVLRRFKQELPFTKVILMTGHGSAVGALNATAYGAYDYLLKPFGVDALLSPLARWLKDRLIERQAKKPYQRFVSSTSVVRMQTDIDRLDAAQCS